MHSLSRHTRIIIIIVVAFLSALAFLYYVIFPAWVKKEIAHLPFGDKEPFTISIEKIYATAWPFGLGLKNVSIQQASPDSSITDSLFIQRITIQQFNPVSLLFQKKYNIGSIILDHPTGEWSLPADDTSKVEMIIPTHFSCQNLTFQNASLTMKKKGSSVETTLENGNLVLKNVLLNKDSLLSSITYEVAEMNLAVVNHVSSDSFYTFRAHHILYSDEDSTLQVDSFFSVPNLEKYAFARKQPYQTDRIQGSFKNITFSQINLSALMTTGDILISSIHADTFLLDIFRDRRRPFLHKKRPLYQDLLSLYPGVLSVDSITAHNGKIIFREHETNASEPGIIWFSDVTANIKHLYNDTTLSTLNDTLMVAAHAVAMDKGKIQFESKGHLRDPHNTFVCTGRMENIPAGAFNPILVPNVAIEVEDGYVHGIYFNFSADNSVARGDLIFRYDDLRLLKVGKESSSPKGIKNRVLTRILNRKILDDNPLPRETLRTGTIYFERDPEKMYFSYMLKSIFSGIRETVMK